MDESESLKVVFERYRSYSFLFVKPGGNWGDYLIYLGAEQLARKIGLEFISIDYEEFMHLQPITDKAVYLHGGGAFNFIYDGQDVNALEYALKKYSGPVIQGPQTSENSTEYMRFLASRINDNNHRDFYLFARERTTFDNLSKTFANGSISVRLDHDTAFHLNREDLLGTHRIHPKYDLLALRDDAERPLHDVPFSHLPGLRLDPPRYAKSLEHWVRIHACSRSIITNRTHSAILSAILGIPATLLPGSYHKNRSIWEYSLRQRGVQWRDWPDSFNQTPGGRLASAMNRARHSYKLNRLRLLLMPLRGVPRK